MGGLMGPCGLTLVMCLFASPRIMRCSCFRLGQLEGQEGPEGGQRWGGANINDIAARKTWGLQYLLLRLLVGHAWAQEKANE